MKVLVEYDKYNTVITKATLPLEDGYQYEIELNEKGDKVQFSTVHELGEDLEEAVASMELSKENIMELSRLLSQIARGIEIKDKE